jgi:hypothetical protein
MQFLGDSSTFDQSNDDDDDDDKDDDGGGGSIEIVVSDHEQQRRRARSSRDARSATRLTLATAALCGAARAADDLVVDVDVASDTTTTTIDFGRVRRASGALLDVALEQLAQHGDVRVLVASLEALASVAECDALLLLPRVTPSAVARADEQDAFVLRSLYPMLDALSHPNAT